MAYYTKGSLSSDSSKNQSISISEITTTKPIEQQLDIENNNDGVYSTIRIDSHEQDGGFISIAMLRH